MESQPCLLQIAGDHEHKKNGNKPESYALARRCCLPRLNVFVNKKVPKCITFKDLVAPNWDLLLDLSESLEEKKELTFSPGLLNELAVSHIIFTWATAPCTPCSGQSLMAGPQTVAPGSRKQWGCHKAHRWQIPRPSPHLMSNSVRGETERTDSLPLPTHHRIL